MRCIGLLADWAASADGAAWTGMNEWMNERRGQAKALPGTLAMGDYLTSHRLRLLLSVSWSVRQSHSQSRVYISMMTALI